MRRTMVGLLAAAAAAMFTFQVSAADTPERQDGPPGPQMMFPRLDKNHDGKVTADEVPEGAPQFVKEMLKRADKDGDKTVTAEEFRGALQLSRGAAPQRPEAGWGGRGPGGPGAPGGPRGWRPGGPGDAQGGRHPPFGPAPGMTPPGRPGLAGPGAPSPESRPDPKALFARLDKDGDQKLSLDEFAAGMKAFHSRVMGPQAMGPHRGMGRSPMMGPGPRGPQPGMGQRPMMGRQAMGPHRGMGGPPMMGQRRFAPRGPMMRPGMPGARAAWGPPAWSKSPWARQAWGGQAGWGAATSGRAAWAMPRGPLPGHGAAILGRLQAADKDKDGKLSKSEAPERLQPHFAKIDANKDGQLDKAELGKAMAAMGKQVRESMEKRRAEMVKKSHEARGDGAHKDAAEKKHAERKPGDRKHGDVKKPIDKKLEQKKAEKKHEEKKAEKKKPDEKKS